MFEVELHGLVFEYTDICITYDRHYVGHVFSLGSHQVRLSSVRVTSSYREQADVEIHFMSTTFACRCLFPIVLPLLLIKMNENPNFEPYERCVFTTGDYLDPRAVESSGSLHPKAFHH